MLVLYILNSYTNLQMVTGNTYIPLILNNFSITFMVPLTYFKFFLINNYIHLDINNFMFIVLLYCFLFFFVH